MPSRTMIIAGTTALLAAVGIGAAFATSHMQHGDGDYAAMHAAHHGSGQGEPSIIHSGQNHTEHDETIMPGLLGNNASPEESAEIGVLFNNFQTITRTVENLPDGIRTITNSTDPAVMEALTSHVVGMIGRVEMKNDPQIIVQSPTLDIFFERADALVTEIEVSDEGIVVLQTSDDPELVEAMHLHAAEVSAMAERGMQALHEMMAGRVGNH